jgi:Family of unknown function (DUF5990)
MVRCRACTIFRCSDASPFRLRDVVGVRWCALPHSRCCDGSVSRCLNCAHAGIRAFAPLRHSDCSPLRWCGCAHSRSLAVAVAYYRDWAQVRIRDAEMVRRPWCRAFDEALHACHRLRCMAHILTIRIIVEQPPAGVDYALQKGRGSAYEPVHRQRSEGKDLVFEFQPVIKEGTASVGMSLMSGPFVQGPPLQRFIYIDIGTYAGQWGTCWSRRMKIPLSGISSRMIGRGGILEARVAGTGRDGTPACATVKDFGGWKALEK